MRDLFIEGINTHQFLENTPEGEPQIESDWLFFSELKTLGSKPKTLRRDQEKLILKLIEHGESDDLSRRIIPEGEVTQESITILLDPPSDIPFWTEPLELTFHYLIWDQNNLQIAHIPCLGIEIAIQSAKEKEEVLEDQLRFALNRRRVNRNLFDLSLLQRCQKLEVERSEWNAYPLSPKERVMREDGDDGAVEPVLEEIGQQIGKRRKVAPLYERDKEVENLASLFKSKRGIGSILLVGESGVGKTAIVHAFAAQQKKLGLTQVRDVYHLPGSRIVAGMSGFGEWQERCRKIALEASTGQGKLLFFGNLLELLEVGQSVSTSESVGSFFRPWMIRGQLLAIAECTPAQLSTIEQKDPRMLEAFRQIIIPPSEPSKARSILKQVVAAEKKTILSPGAQKRIFLLHKRYSGYSALPGKMLHFARRLMAQNQPPKGAEPTRIPPSSVNQLFALESGLPKFLLDDSAKMDCDRVTQWFEKRIKGQSDAVGHIVDTIATVKARLTRPNRPLGSFLFVGPTGVGKTELAKTLAEFFYGSQDRLIRIDMSEYSTPGSSTRLASGAPGEPEGILTSKMRDQPFSVLLLDEFEKADPSVFDLFLQVMGEARLTDGAGRLADFSNAMIILTSNLGASEFRATAPGFSDPNQALSEVAIDHFVNAAKKRFRPEFFNRIGRIVPFLPLDDDSINQVVEREIGKLDQRDGFKNRELTLIVDPGVVTSLCAMGSDPRYGARPLKRRIEEKILKPISHYLIEHPHSRKGTIEVDALSSNDELDFSYRAEDEDRGKTEKEKLKQWNERIPNLRRWYQILANSNLVSELHSETRRLERRVKHKPGNRDHETLAHSRKLLERLETDSAITYQLEESLLITTFQNTAFLHLEKAVDDAPEWSDFCDLLRDIYIWIKKGSSRITLVFMGDDNALVSSVAGVYRQVASDYGCKIKSGYYRKITEDEDLDIQHPNCRKPYLPESAQEIESLFSGSRVKNCVAIGIELTKPQIGARFMFEVGLHQFIDITESKRHVQILGFPDESFKFEEGWIDDETLLDRDFTDTSIRRSWDSGKSLMKDQIWGTSEDSDRIDPRELPPEFSVEAINTLIEITLIDEALDTIRE